MKEFGIRMVDSPNTIEPQSLPAPPADRVDLSKLFSAMRRQKWIVAIAAMIGLMFGILYLATTPRSYFAATTVMLDANVNRSVDEVSVIEGGTGDSALEGAIQIIRSQQLAVQVVERLRLDENQVFLNPPVSLMSRGMGMVIGILRLPLSLLRSSDAPSGTPAAPPSPEVITQLRRNAVAMMLRGRLIVGREGRSAVLSIGYISHDPGLTAAIANAYAEAYAADVLNANFEATERTTEWLRSRLDALQENAFDAAMVAEAFRIQNGLVSSRTSGGLMSEQNAAQLNNELANAMAEVARAQALLGTYEVVLGQGPEVLAEPGRAGGFAGAATDSRLTETQGQLSALNARLRQIEIEFGPDHPQAQAVRTQIARLAETLFAEISRLRDDAKGGLDVAQARVNALRESLGLAVDASSAEGSAQVRLRALEQQARTLETLYQSFLSRFEEIEQQKSFPISNVRVLSPAEVPRAAAGPRTMRTLAMMLVLGGIVGCVIGLWREWRDWFFRTGESIEEETGHRFLGYLPSLPQEATPPAKHEGGVRARPLPETGDIPLVQRPLYALQNPRSLFTETLQNVRFTSDMLLAGKSSRIIGLTSILPGEGKTTVALNLAGLTAASGAETLLIDCDPRNPGLSRDLRHLRGNGLVEAITGQIPWQSALRAVGETGLHILPCVAPSFMTHVGDLLNAPQMQRILEEARQKYSHIVLDLPPLGPVVDARLLLPQVDQALMVVEWGKTPRSLVRKAIARDPVLAGRIMGIVLNKTDMERLKAYSPETDAEHHYGEYGGYLAS